MHRCQWIVLGFVIVLTGIVTGCEEDENQRLAEMAERNLERQAEQNRQMNEMQRRVAEGAQRLVEADAQARQEMVTLQREVQAERTEVGRQRDRLEEERRELAAQRHRDPIVASAITYLGLLLACLLPVGVCWLLLRCRPEPIDDVAVVEVLLEDLVASRPLLLGSPDKPVPELPRGEPETGDEQADW